jgi:hypothetical protein
MLFSEMRHSTEPHRCTGVQQQNATIILEQFSCTVLSYILSQSLRVPLNMLRLLANSRYSKWLYVPLCERIS